PIMRIDLKDCFFTIPLAAQDCIKFTFSIPSTNNQEPMQQFHWTVLLQGMKYSPTICQMYVAKTLSPVRVKHPQVIIYHYMDDILITEVSESQLHFMVREVI
ncbi:POK8 protein, partial [Aegotheles bennettii]|nr:POK8 protein [Aegotheles bennettii]